MGQIRRIEITQMGDFLKLEDNWKEIECGNDMTAFQSFDWNKLLVEQWLSDSFNRVFSKLYIYIQMDERNYPYIIAPVFVQKYTIGFSWVGRHKGIYILGDSSYSDYLNFIYTCVDINELRNMISKIKQDLSDNGRVPLYLNCIREKTLLYQAIMSVQNEKYKEVKSVYINIPKTEDEFYRSLSKHTRQNLRTARNRLEKDGKTYRMEILHGRQSGSFANSLDEIHTKRVKSKNRNQQTDSLRKISRFFMNKHLEKKQRQYNIVVESMQSNEASYYCIVYIDDNIVGYLYGLADGKAIRIMQNCFDEEYKYYSPLFCGSYDAISTEINCAVKRYEEFDFTRGDEEYKYKLGGQEVLLGYFMVK